MMSNITNSFNQVQKMRNIDLTSLRLIEYFRCKFSHNGALFYKKHIPVLRIKMHELMILIVRYYFLARVYLMRCSNYLSW